MIQQRMGILLQQANGCCRILQGTEVTGAVKQRRNLETKDLLDIGSTTTEQNIIDSFNNKGQKVMMTLKLGWSMKLCVIRK